MTALSGRLTARSSPTARLLAATTLGAMIVALEVAPASAQQPPIVILSNVPADIPGGAPNADLATAAAFAWQEFIALNWPAQAGVREVPDTSLPFGYRATAGGPPLVWQTLRHKVEMFPPRDQNNVTAPLPAPHGAEKGPPFYGYDDPPAYFYVPQEPNPATPTTPIVASSDGSIAACPNQNASPSATAPYVNLDETTQIGLDSMFAGVVPNAPTALNSAPQLIRFMAKGNRAQYLYVMQNDYWYRSAGLVAAQQNYQNAVAKGTPLRPPFVFFPVGTIEVKSAWRPLAPTENASRFHTTTVRFYETTGPADNMTICHVDAQWALLALHITHKTPTAPGFVFATFEQADNILDAGGKPIEDENGAVVIPQPGPPTEPPQFYRDSRTNPIVSLDPGAKYCADTGPRLFYHELFPALPGGGNICVRKRYHDIPQVIQAVNRAAHGAIVDYENRYRVPGSPWRYYKLVNVQAFPFDKTVIDNSNPNSPHGAPTFFQANSVVETDYTLQNFSGRISIGGPPTDYPVGGTGSDFKNLHLFTEFPPSVRAYNMGGCQGCHANAQLGGNDFSFILDGNTFQTTPDAPGPANSKAAAERYRLRFKKLE
jgi:hypothetical protein